MKPDLCTCTQEHTQYTCAYMYMDVRDDKLSAHIHVHILTYSRNMSTHEYVYTCIHVYTRIHVYTQHEHTYIHGMEMYTKIQFLYTKNYTRTHMSGGWTWPWLYMYTYTHKHIYIMVKFIRR